MTRISDIRQRLLEGVNCAFDNSDVKLLDEELQDLVALIEAAPSFSNCEDVLRRLGELQEVLATMWFKYDTSITPRQKELVRKFDRPDDPALCQIVVKEIKEGRFLKG